MGPSEELQRESLRELLGRGPLENVVISPSELRISESPKTTLMWYEANRTADGDLETQRASQNVKKCR